MDPEGSLPKHTLPDFPSRAAAYNSVARPIIDAWLEADQTKPRKQRHTAQRIYERLRDEHGFCVRRRAFSDDAVRSLWRHEPVVAGRRLDLSHRPELVGVSDGVRPADVYDQLLHREEVAA